VSTYELCILAAFLTLFVVGVGLGYDFIRGDVRPRNRDDDFQPTEVGPCVHCGRDYHDHEAKYHYCPTKSGWAEVTFQEGARK